ncbi:uncharacterized protein NFIA_009860 [Aspergillus fischeri NRRL 181]|uniref:Uncharacterized protein n=1 Tax=Neosartorya fischeri (strain ATCC 1020 / DSM 3700 / CBS 544.65 / FGSC A1164 / JCM 1740 / NRRL 181 / WB 181) TaxID=331117 RepID=A1D1L3_NEOFI|nr:uncharacterized protein NFIA_009860 [Aspergillus fischeri NRRL 181]EAW22306.1 hypothetical protein NFIA_009860 [Aspergillus fischeri NRRL 181]
MAASAGKAARDYLRSHEHSARACLIEGMTTSLGIPQIQHLDQWETFLRVHADLDADVSKFEHLAAVRAPSPNTIQTIHANA